MILDSPATTIRNRYFQPLLTCPPRFVLDRLAAGATVPAVPADRWLDAIYAPQAHANARRDYRRRAEELTGILNEPGVANLTTWAQGQWPASVPALAGVLAAAPVLQVAARTEPVDPAWVSQVLETAVRDARELSARRQRSGMTRHRDHRLVYGVELDRVVITADSDGRSEPEAAVRAEEVTAWLGEVTGTARRSPRALLVVEANLPAFWAWYARRVPLEEVAAGRYPAPPLTRQLGTGQRLEDHLAGSWDGGADRQRMVTVGRLLLGPRRYRGWPPEHGWRAGVGYCSLLALAALRDDHQPPAPPAETLRWWTMQITSLATQPAPWEAPDELGVRTVVA